MCKINGWELHTRDAIICGRGNPHLIAKRKRTVRAAGLKRKKKLGSITYDSNGGVSRNPKYLS